MEVFLLSIHYTQQILSYIFYIKLVSFKNIEVWLNLGKSEFEQNRMPVFELVQKQAYLANMISKIYVKNQMVKQSF